jgi:hypothetical protein
MPKAPKKTTTELFSMTRNEIEELVVQVVKRELSSLVKEFEARGEKGRGGSKVTKRTVSIPSDLWQQFRRECPGPASSHVTAAIRLYLITRQSEQT